MFEEAKRCGADAVKLQKRDNRSLFTREFFDKPYDNENSFGATYGAHREALEFGRDEYLELIAYAGELGIAFFATAFDFAERRLPRRARHAGLQDRLRRPDATRRSCATSPRSASR